MLSGDSQKVCLFMSLMSKDPFAIKKLTIEICQLIGVSENFSLICLGFGELCISEVEDILAASCISILLPSQWTNSELTLRPYCLSSF